MFTVDVKQQYTHSKGLEPSFKMGLDFGVILEGKKSVLQLKKYGTLYELYIKCGFENQSEMIFS